MPNNIFYMSYFNLNLLDRKSLESPLSLSVPCVSTVTFLFFNFEPALHPFLFYLVPSDQSERLKNSEKCMDQSEWTPRIVFTNQRKPSIQSVSLLTFGIMYFFIPSSPKRYYTDELSFLHSPKRHYTDEFQNKYLLITQLSDKISKFRKCEVHLFCQF